SLWGSLLDGNIHQHLPAHEHRGREAILAGASTCLLVKRVQCVRNVLNRPTQRRGWKSSPVGRMKNWASAVRAEIDGAELVATPVGVFAKFVSFHRRNPRITEAACEGSVRQILRRSPREDSFREEACHLVLRLTRD